MEDTSRKMSPELVSNLLRDGHFARKQLYCKSRVIAWSHGSRFRMARRLVSGFAGGKLLDYGCGDGTFLATVFDLFPDSTGADIARDAVDGCARRFGALGSIRFVHTSALADERYRGTFDVVTCMETLEHCVPSAVDSVLADLHRLVRPGGRVIISVPIEIGPMLLIKQSIRAIAGWRRLGQYQHREKYSFSELCRMSFAGATTRIERPIYYDDADSSGTHGHKGFNWRALRRRISRDFQIGRICFSPFNWSRGWLSSQVWFECIPERRPQ